MKKILFYSHDSYGLGNIRRTLSICQALVKSDSNVSILLFTGSPLIHQFSIPRGVEYIKLPCPIRRDKGKENGLLFEEEQSILANLRKNILLCATQSFQPDVIMVNRRPAGFRSELLPSLDYVRNYLPETKLILVLRDILDSPEITRKTLEDTGFHDVIQKFYQEILVLGSREIFDPCEEYHFPVTTKEKVRFCGFIKREPGQKPRLQIRRELGVAKEESLVLVTAGGGQDGLHILETYLEGIKGLSSQSALRTLMILGPEMPSTHGARLSRIIKDCGLPVQLMNFTEDAMSYVDAADLVVSMGGYGTVCEILTLNKRAIVVPRIDPVEEQGVRAQRMANLGIFQTIHPKNLTPKSLTQSVVDQLSEVSFFLPQLSLDMSALPNIVDVISKIMSPPILSSPPSWPIQDGRWLVPHPGSIPSMVHGVYGNSNVSSVIPEKTAVQ